MTDRSVRIVLVGGGHTHALVLRELCRSPIPRTEVVLVNPGNQAAYSGMLPGFVAGHYTLDQLYIDLESLVRGCGANLIDGRVIGVDGRRREVFLRDGPRLEFDLLSFDVGITCNMPELSGFGEFAVPAKPLKEFAQRWRRYRLAHGPKSVAVIGGGIAGVELALAMAYALRSEDTPAKVRIIDHSTLLSSYRSCLRRRLRRELQRADVDVTEHAKVEEVDAAGMRLDDGTELKAEFVVGAASATPHPWIQETELEQHRGSIVVDGRLCTSLEGVFAVGDCAHLGFDPRPKAGVFAVRQAPVLHENLRRSVSGQTLLNYEPQTDYLKLVSLGGRRAFGERSGVGLCGEWVWRFKDRIDRGFMRQFEEPFD